MAYGEVTAGVERAFSKIGDYDLLQSLLEGVFLKRGIHVYPTDSRAARPLFTVRAKLKRGKGEAYRDYMLYIDAIRYAFELYDEAGDG